MSAYSLTRIRKAWGLTPLRPRTAHWAVLPSRVRIPAALPNTKKAPSLGLSFETGGGGGIRTLVTRVTGKTVFETAAFNHSATPPHGVRSACRSGERSRSYENAAEGGWPYAARLIWRRDGDSNPGYAFGAYTISNRAPSASSDISPRTYSCIGYAAAIKYTARVFSKQEEKCCATALFHTACPPREDRSQHRPRALTVNSAPPTCSSRPTARPRAARRTAPSCARW